MNRFRCTCAALFAICLPWTVACAASPEWRSTRLTPDDLLEISDTFAARLAESDLMAQRSPDSEPWLVSIQKVTNLTRDVMTESERWLIMQHLRASMPIDALRRQRNIAFVLSAEGSALLRRQGLEDEWEAPALADRRVTHTMTATFRSVIRQTPQGAAETYLCEFELFRLGDREPVWIDAVVIRRQASGHIWD